MRLIGHLTDETSARAFTDYLYVQGIENQLEKKEAKNAQDRRAKEEQEQEDYRKRVRGRRNFFKPLTTYGFGPLTFVMIVASVVVFFLSKFYENPEAIKGLFISMYIVEGRSFSWQMIPPEIRQGQIWRLITPIFIHMGPLHILFNMLWLQDLGSMVEGRQSSLHLLIFTLVVAACSNFAQYFVSGPAFGGMSGVVYGLLGYVWLRGKFEPASGLYLHSYNVTMMLIWFFACLLNIIPHVANTAHAVGLGMGMAWGYLSSLRFR